MLERLRTTFLSFPRQFWLVAFGVLLSASGSSMIWPFQLIYVSKTLGQPISTIATLITISSVTGMAVSFLGGSIADRVGRKPVMIIAQVAHAFGFLLMSRATSYIGFLIPMTIMGAAMPFYAIGSDAMMADMLPPEKRNDGYSILRMLNNAGIAIGPAIGGFIVSKSYALAFYGAAICTLAYGLILLLFARETLVRRKPAKAGKVDRQPQAGYLQVLRDGHFITFVLAVATGLIAPLMMWTLLAVYTKTNYGLPEYRYSWIPITNALMCVFVQYFVTMLTRRFKPLPVIAAGMLLYALGVGSVALMSGFWGFWTSIVILTFGELTLVPTGTTYAANRAPADLRGRYMTVYWLTWGLARAFAPMIGGFLNDQIAPKAIWIGGLVIGLASTVGLSILANRQRERQPVPSPIVEQ